MKSVRSKLIIVLALVVGMYIVLEATFGRAVIMPEFRSLQDELAANELKQCKALLDRELAAIARTAKDWSMWDDTYEFVANGNAQYVKSNLTDSLFEVSRLNVAFILNTDGSVLWGRIYDDKSRSFITLPELTQDSIRKMPALYRHSSVDLVRKGILVTGRCPILLCSSPITTSQMEGPIRGAVVFGRFLDERYVRELGSVFNLDFRVRVRTPGTELDPTVTKKCTITEKGSESLLVSLIVPDILGMPSLVIEATVPTLITARSRQVTMFMSVSTLLIGATILALTYWLLRYMVLTRLAKLDACITRVAATQDLSIRADVGGDDELGRAGNSLNAMLERLNETEKALLKSDQRFRAAFFSAPFPIMIYSDDGTVLQVNRKWAQTTGYMPEDIRTLDAWSEKAYGLGPAARGGSEPLRELKDGQFTVRTKAGKTLVWQLTSVPLSTTVDGKRVTLVTAVDVTERDALERRVSDSEQRYRCLSENIPVVTYMARIDRDGTIVYINPQVKKFFGFTPEEILLMPKARKNFIHPEDRERVLREYYKACSERRAFMCDYRALGRDGNTIWVREEAQVIDTIDGPMAQGVIYDISRSKMLELKIREANARLTEADKLKTDFLVNVSHELRTPLTIFRNVISNAVANVYGPLPAALRDNITMCEESVQRLSRVISDFLDMSRIEAKKLKLNLASVDINAVCQEAVQAASGAASAKGVALRCYPTEQPVHVRADRERIVQVLNNLVSNGIKFSPEAAGRVEVHVKQRQEDAVVEIRDNGKGIEPADTGKLFKRFVQLESQIGPGAHGTGLGLAIAREIVELHGGRIWVESTPGRGATFGFSLPLASQTDAVEAQKDDGKEEEPEPVDGGGKALAARAANDGIAGA